MEIMEFLDTISKYTMEEYWERYGEIEAQLETIEEVICHSSKQSVEDTVKKIAAYAEQTPLFCRIHLLSFCMKVSGNRTYTEKLLQEVLSADYEEVGEYNKISHFEQILSAVFNNTELGSPSVELMLTQLYKNLFQAFMDCFGIKKREYIPLGERNKNLVFVLIDQVLGMNHAPTKTLLDRCYVLKKYLKKDIFIINTAIFVPRKGRAPFYKMCVSNYASALREVPELEFRGEHFNFYQCSENMPDLEEMADIIRLVKKYKPLYILDIGGSDWCADLCGLFVPQITVSTVFSKIALSCGEYQLVDKELNENDRNQLHILEVNPDNVIRTMFTFSFKEQEHHYTREELGLPQDKFILLVVGWRLDDEIDSEFLDMLEKTILADEDIVVAFMGQFNLCEEKMAAFRGLTGRFYNLGIQEDALAVTECCDLYVNPRRNGGGSSVAEALYKGIPAVTLPLGDVSVAAGDSFWVQNFQKMEEQILLYHRDKRYYDKMAEEARTRSRLLTDSASAWGTTMKTIEEMLK